MYAEDGTELGPVKDLVDPFLRSKAVGEELGRQGEVEHKVFELVWEMAKLPNRLYLKSLVPDELRAIVRMKITGRCSFEVSEFRLRKGVVDNVKVAWGMGQFAAQKTLLVASEDARGNRMLSLTTKAPPPAKRRPGTVVSKRQKRLSLQTERE